MIFTFDCVTLQTRPYTKFFQGVMGKKNTANKILHKKNREKNTKRARKKNSNKSKRKLVHNLNLGISKILSSAAKRS